MRRKVSAASTLSSTISTRCGNALALAAGVTLAVHVVLLRKIAKANQRDHDPTQEKCPEHAPQQHPGLILCRHLEVRFLMRALEPLVRDHGDRLRQI